MAQLFSFARKVERRSDWSQSEIAELYRIEHALLQAGFVLETDLGVTDEGDPWFVFCRGDGEVLVHITRAEGQYHLFSAALANPLRGRLISELSKSFVEHVPVFSPVRRTDPKVFVHPASMLAILIGTIFVAFDDLGLSVSPDSGRAQMGNEAMDRSTSGNDARSMLHAAFASYAELLPGTSHGDELRDETHRGNSYFGIVCAVAAAIGTMAPSSDLGTPITASVPEMIDGYIGSLLPADELNRADWIEREDDIPHKPMARETFIADSIVVDDAASEVFPQAVAKAQIDIDSPFAAGQYAEATLTVRLDGDVEFSQVRIGRGVGDFPADRTASGDRSQAALPEEGGDSAHGVPQVEKLQVQFRLADMVPDHGRALPATIDDLLHEFLKSISSPGENNFAGALRVSAGDDNSTPGPDSGGVLTFPKYDAAAQDILAAFLQANPQTQVAFDHQSLIVYDGNLDFDNVRSVSVRIWEFESGDTIAIVGYADEIGVHI